MGEGDTLRSGSFNSGGHRVSPLPTGSTGVMKHFPGVPPARASRTSLEASPSVMS